jgi:hypothetical protein
MKKSYLALRDTSLRKPKASSVTQLLIVEGTQAWTKEEAKELMVNNISLALRKVMVNAHNYNNPLKQWEDAIWYYKWVELDVESNHYVCLAFIPIRIVDLILQKPMDYSRDTTSKEIRQMLLKIIKMGKLNLIENIPSLLAFLGLLKKDLANHSFLNPRTKEERTFINFEKWQTMRDMHSIHQPNLQIFYED